MNPAQWEAAGHVFEQALALPGGERTAFVDRACAGDEELRREVSSLVASHRASPGGFVQERIERAATAFFEASAHPPRVGPYRLIRELGRGGMGTVFLAERDDDQYRASVAVKLVRPGMDTEFILVRFRRERQTLARLQHPNISRLLDGGTTDQGLPYIVMEYIDGPAVTVFADQAALGLPERLALFRDLCSAVDYAHRNFIIHRDLKPGNILVGSDGVPNLLDFGICKLLQAEPSSGDETVAAPMTPNYASPEQIRGEPATPLSDVYALGAVLYELLTGQCPRRFDGLTPVAVEQRLATSAIQLPSAAAAGRKWARQLTGDLDNVVMRALETDPARRYESAAQFAEDVRRYLEHEPVRARPQTRWYRAGKFVQRHRGGVAAAAAILVVLAGGLAASLYQARVAESRLQQVRSLADALVFDVHDAVRDLPGATRARATIVKTGVRYLNSLVASASGDPKAEARLATAYRRLGDAQGGIESSNLGATSEALVSYRQAASLLDDALRRAPADLEAVTERLIVEDRIGTMQGYTGKVRDSLATFQNAIRAAAPFETTGDAGVREALGAIYIQSSEAHRNLEDYQAALHDSREALRLFTGLVAVRGTDAVFRSSLAESYAAVGMAEIGLLQLPEALGHFRQGVDEMERLVAADPRNAPLKRDLMMAYGHVADVLGNPGVGNLGDRAAAFQAFRRAADLAKELYEVDRVNQRAVSDYGIALSRVETVMDDGPEKIQVQRDSLAVLGEAAAIDPANVQMKVYEVLVAQHLGDSLVAAGDARGAREAYARAVQVAEPALSSGQASLLILFTQTAQRLARVDGASGRRSEALDVGRRAVQASESGATRTRARGYAAPGFAYAALAESAARQPGDREQALSWLKKSLDAWRTGKSEPGFTALHQREMDQVAQAIARLETR